MSYIILGSCVTRDVFRVAGEDARVGTYLSRTALPSVVSPPLCCPVTIALESAFQQRMVHNDLYKDLNSVLSEPNATIILDSIDERFNLVRFGKTILTRSMEMVRSGVLDQLSGWQVLPRRSDEARALWRESCRRLRALVHPTSTLILHEAYWCEEYLSENGRSRFAEQWELIQRNNEDLAFYYAEIRRHLRPAVVAAPPEFQVASPAHTWGLAPYHYVDEYYREVWAQIRAIAE